MSFMPLKNDSCSLLPNKIKHMNKERKKSGKPEGIYSLTTPMTLNNMCSRMKSTPSHTTYAFSSTHKLEQGHTLII